LAVKVGERSTHFSALSVEYSMRGTEHPFEKGRFISRPEKPGKAAKPIVLDLMPLTLIRRLADFRKTSGLSIGKGDQAYDPWKNELGVGEYPVVFPHEVGHIVFSQWLFSAEEKKALNIDQFWRGHFGDPEKLPVLAEKDVPALALEYQKLIGAATPQALTRAPISWGNSLNEIFAHNVERLAYGAPFLVSPVSKAATDDILHFFLKIGIINTQEAENYRILSARMNGGKPVSPVKTASGEHVSEENVLEAHMQWRIYREEARLGRKLTLEEEAAFRLEGNTDEATVRQITGWLQENPSKVVWMLEYIGEAGIMAERIREKYRSQYAKAGSGAMEEFLKTYEAKRLRQILAALLGLSSGKASLEDVLLLRPFLLSLADRSDLRFLPWESMRASLMKAIMEKEKALPVADQEKPAIGIGDRIVSTHTQTVREVKDVFVERGKIRLRLERVSKGGERSVDDWSVRAAREFLVRHRDLYQLEDLFGRAMTTNVSSALWEDMSGARLAAEQKEIWRKVFLDEVKKPVLKPGYEVSLSARRLVEEIKIPVGAKVLDVGSWMGHDALYFAEKGLNVTAIDVIQEPLDRLKKIADEKGLASRIEVRVHDLNEALPFSSNSFDVIYAHLSMHYLGDETLKKRVREMHEMLKPGGKLVIVGRSTEDKKFISAARREGSFIIDSEGKRQRFFDEINMKSIFEGVFEEVSVRKVPPYERYIGQGEMHSIEFVATKEAPIAGARLTESTLAGSTKYKEFGKPNASRQEKISKALSEYDLQGLDVRSLQVRELDGRPPEPPLMFVTGTGSAVLKMIGRNQEEARFVVSSVNRLIEAGLPVPKLFIRRGQDPAIADSYILPINEGYYMIESMADGIAVPLTELEPRKSWILGRLMARMHDILGTQPVEGYRTAKQTSEIIHVKDEIVALRAEIQAVSSDKRTKGDRFFLDNVDEFLLDLEILKERLPESWYLALPRYVIHKDLNVMNVLVGWDSDEVSAVFDWDRSSLQPRISDFANPVMTDHRVDAARGRVYDRERLIDIVAAYQSAAKEPLSDRELKAIPEILRATFLWSIASYFVLRRDKLEDAVEYARAAHTVESFHKFQKDFPGSEDSVNRFVELVRERIPLVRDSEGGRREVIGARLALQEGDLNFHSSRAQELVVRLIGLKRVADPYAVAAEINRYLDELARPETDLRREAQRAIDDRSLEPFMGQWVRGKLQSLLTYLYERERTLDLAGERYRDVGWSRNQALFVIDMLGEVKANELINFRFYGERPRPPMQPPGETQSFTQPFGARLVQTFIGTAYAAQTIPAQDPGAFELNAEGLLSPELARKGIDEKTPFWFINIGNAVVRASLAADRRSGTVLFYDLDENGEAMAEPFAELPITPDTLRKAEARMRAAKEIVPVARLEKELEKAPVLEAVSGITRAISLHAKAKGAMAPLADLETRTNVVAAVPIPDKGLDPREKQVIAKIFEALAPLFRSKVTLVFTSPRVFTDKDKKTLDLVEPAVLPEGPYNVMVLSNPALPSLLENIEDAAGIAPMPESDIRGDVVEIGPYAIALLLADLIGSADEDGLQKLLQDTSIEQLLRQAMGAKYDIELGKDRAGIVKAMQSADKEKREFYLKIVFERIRPLNFSQLLEVVRMVVQAVGAAA